MATYQYKTLMAFPSFFKLVFSYGYSLSICWHKNCNTNDGLTNLLCIMYITLVELYVPLLY